MKKKQVQVYDPETNRYRTFLTDADGMSAKDAVITFGLGIFLLLLVIGGFKELFMDEGITTNYIELVKTAVPIISTAVGGIFGVQVASQFKRKDREEVKHESYK